MSSRTNIVKNREQSQVYLNFAETGRTVWLLAGKIHDCIAVPNRRKEFFNKVAHTEPHRGSIDAGMTSECIQHKKVPGL